MKKEYSNLKKRVDENKTVIKASAGKQRHVL